MTSPVAWPWVLAGGLAAVAALGVWAWRTRRGGPGHARWVAHTDGLVGVPGVRAAFLLAAAVRVVGVVAVVVAVVSAAVLAARPVSREVVVDRLGTRDIVLCLDVSGSMVPFDSAIVDTFAELVEGFSGERIALSIFNSTSRTVFPLTDDYTLVLEELEAAQRALEFDVEAFDPNDERTWGGIEEFLAFSAGTVSVPGESSLIGDGLASCALLFDEGTTERSRSIVLATDNDVYGEPIYSLPDAVDLVRDRDITLYGLYGGEEDLRGSPQNEEFTQAVERSGGRSWNADDPSVVDTIIDDVTREQAVAISTDDDVRLVDRPQPWFTLLLVAVPVAVLVRWRVGG